MQRELNRYLGRFKSEAERELYFFQSMAKHLGRQPSTERRRDKRIEEKAEKLDNLVKVDKVEKLNKLVEEIKKHQLIDMRESQGLERHNLPDIQSRLLYIVAPQK